MAKPAQKKDVESVRANEKKWGKPLMEAGWTVMPSTIIEKQHALGLDAIDINILLHLQVYWWEAENTPHPSKNRIAEALGLAPRTIQRRIAKLEAHGLITREAQYDKAGGQRPNRYNFNGLIEHATPFAQEKLDLLRKQKQERQKSVSRKSKPRLVSVAGTEKGGNQ